MKDKIIAFGSIFLMYLFLELMGVTCPIKFLTGVSCLGCGMSRAWLSLLRFDFAGAFYYHPLFAAPAIWIVIFLFRDRIKPSVFKAMLLITLILFGVVYLYRLIYFKSDVVVFDPTHSAFAHFFV